MNPVELANEDKLRLNVLLANVEAIIFDEGRNEVRGLGPQGESKVSLHPTARDDLYHRQVKRFLAERATGDPHGIPGVLRRGAELGQLSREQAASLLMVGEPEIYACLAASPRLDPDYVAYIWWATPTAEVACQLLGHGEVVASPLGPELAHFLLEWLPFEQESANQLLMLRRIAQPGLLEPATQRQLWQRGGRRVVYRLGFLEHQPLDLPCDCGPEPELPPRLEGLSEWAASGEPMARQLLHLQGARARLYLGECLRALREARSAEMAALAINLLGRRCHGDPSPLAPQASLAAAEQQARAWLTQHAPPLSHGLGEAVIALGVLMALDERIFYPTFARTTATGTLLARKLAGDVERIAQWLACLWGEAHGGD